MNNQAIEMFTATDKYAGHAMYAATEKMNAYLATVPADQVVSIQFQQSTYRDMDGDYPQDMFWYTLLVTTRVVAEVPEPEQDNPVAEAYRLIREAGTRYVLHHNDEGYFLTDLSDRGHTFWGVPRDEVLARVQRVLGIQPAVTVPADDFDPFLDSDDLP